MAQDLRALADEDLMQLVAAGKARAFEVVYERHASRGVLARLPDGRHAHGAEDVTQEAFLNLWRSGAHYDRAPRLGAHLGPRDRPPPRDRRPAPRVGARQAARDDEGTEERFEAPERTEDEVARRDEAATVRNAMDVLPAEQLQVIELAYFGGFTHVEIAEMLETPVGTVKGRMRLGLKKMRERLARRER